MKTIVIYNSQTEFTKRYAKWIAEEAGADKKLIAFCVGASPIDNPEIETSLKQNFNESEWKKVNTFIVREDSIMKKCLRRPDL